MNSSGSFVDIFPWNDNFNTGINEIDSQHKTLVRLLNKLANTLFTSDDCAIESVFNELSEYAHYHFESEEAIWATHLSQDSIETIHKKEHESFIPNVLNIQEENKSSPLEVQIEVIIKFLIRWLSFHIIASDKKLSIIVKSIQQGKSLEEAKNFAEKEMLNFSNVLVETIMMMYEGLSTTTFELMRERAAHQQAKEKLLKANKKMEKLSITDQLTGLFNRRHFDFTIDNELKKAIREKYAVSLLIIDVDFFKKLNDRYGHQEGDKALVSIAECLNRTCRRPNEAAFRLGGEEFAIISTHQNKNQTKNFAEIILTSIEALQIPNENSEVSNSVTVSLGAYVLIPEQGRESDELFKFADRNLYKAKQSGRNCYKISEP